MEAGFLVASEHARAQSTENNNNRGSYTPELPPVEVTSPQTGTKPTPRRPRTEARPAAAAAPRAVAPRLVVYPTSPTTTPSTAVAVDKVPSSINFVNTPEIQRTDSLNIMESLQQSVA